MPASRLTHIAALGVISIALAATTPFPGAAQRSGGEPASIEVKQQSRELLPERVADQLGVKLAPGQPTAFTIGSSLTGMLTDSTKLAAFGARDVHIGARVTISRVAPEKVRLEIDELDPVPRTTKLTLHIDSEGRLSTTAP